MLSGAHLVRLTVRVFVMAGGYHYRISDMP
jgi:hypothetical protein